MSDLLLVLEAGRLLDEVETARILKISVAKLQRDRCLNSENPEIPYVKIGRSVRYSPEVIRDLIEKRGIGSLSKIIA